MFIIVRTINGAKEILKDSNSLFTKTFNDFSAAQALVQKLNQHTNSPVQWSVERK
ncbi:hypothetical protein [Metabacillus fastidiosus]|uniref:hypothetical protein n=1 Tax=Metabacillus fastidiosus TaxID=1458 RepID=UPI003D2CC3AD